MTGDITLEITAEKIIKGQRRIDEMRIEIKQLLNSLLTMIPREEILTRCKDKFKLPIVKPNAHFFKMNKRGYSWVITASHFYFVSTDQRTGVKKIVYKQGDVIPMASVSLIHEHLDSLVTDLLDLFPLLGSQLYWIVKAEDA